MTSPGAHRALLVAGVIASSAGMESPRPASNEQALAAFARLPLAFVANVGQADPSIRFYAHGPDFTFAFRGEGAMLAFTRDGGEGTSLRLRFLGANPAPDIQAGSTSAGTVSYFVGHDPARWRSGVATSDEMVYRGLWPGIDVAFRGQDGQLKYEVRLAPGADPARVGLAYDGAESLIVDGGGSLLIGTPLGALRDSPPVAFQVIGGRSVAVPVRYTLLPRAGSYGFVVGAYDSGRPLVIDPGLAYSTYLGGSGFDAVPGIAIDDRGNAYVCGRTSSPNFPTTPGSFQPVDPDPTVSEELVTDAFVAKLDPTGSALVYSTYLGGKDRTIGHSEVAFRIAVDRQGSAYVTGLTNASDFPTTPGAFRTSDPDPGNNDAFVTKLSPSGAALAYSTYLGGTGEDSGSWIAVDQGGSAYVIGNTRAADFPTTPGAFQAADPDPTGPDAYVVKLDRTGSALVYSTYLGGTGNDQGIGIAVHAGSAYVAGITESSVFPTTPGAFRPVDPDPSGEDGFVARLNPAGTALLYSTYLGGNGEDGAYGVAVDRTGSAYVVGISQSSNFPTTPGAFQPADPDSGQFDATVTKLEPSGSGLVYSTYLGGGADDFGFGIAVDPEGSAHVTQGTFSNDFPTTPDAFQRVDPDPKSQDTYLAKLDAAGATLLYSTYLGGTGEDFGTTIAVDEDGGVYLATRTTSTDFPTTPGAFQLANQGGVEGAVTKFTGLNRGTATSKRSIRGRGWSGCRTTSASG